MRTLITVNRTIFIRCKNTIFQVLTEELQGLQRVTAFLNRSKKIYFCRNYIEFMKGMKNFVLLIVSFFISLSLYAQTQYDYYDDSASTVYMFIR